MYNLRYHIASLVAVFLALAVGLLLGTIVAEQGMLDSQGAAMVEDLQKRFDEISAKNAELEEGLKQDRAFVEDAVGPMTAGRLTGMHVVVITPQGGDETVAAARAAVEGAGGAVTVVTLNTPGLGLDKGAPESLRDLLEARGLAVAEPGAPLREQVAELMAAEWRSGAERPVTELLVSEGLMTMENEDVSAPVDAVVVVGDAEGACDELALSIAKKVRALGGRAVGAEMVATPEGVAARCDAEGISSVDHLATPQGRFSLVYVLAGLAEGHYGGGEGAVAYYPPIVAP